MTLTLNITAPKKGVSSMPLKTNQTASSVSGDDGDTQRGRNFLTLPIVGGVQQLNFFGTKWRFTGFTGGYFDFDTSSYKDVSGTVTTRSGAFPDLIALDWSTFNYDNDVLGYYIEKNGSDIGFNAASLEAMTLVIGGFSDWRITNRTENYSLINHGVNNSMDYEPFDFLDDSIFLWTGTEVARDTSLGYVVYYQNGSMSFLSKSTTFNMRYIAVRVFNTSEL